MYRDVPLNNENTVSISLKNCLFQISFKKAGTKKKIQGLINKIT